MFTPMNKKILVALSSSSKDGGESVTKTAGGIIIPKIVSDNTIIGGPIEGVIVSLAEDVELPLKVGDTILYGEFGGQDVEVDGRKLVLVDSDDVIVVLEK